MAKSAEFNAAFRNFHNRVRDNYFPDAHTNYPINMSITLHRNAVQRDYMSFYNYCSSIFFSNIAYESLGRAISNTLYNNRAIEQRPKIYSDDLIALYNERRGQKLGHKPKLDFCQHYLLGMKFLPNFPNEKNSLELIPNTQLFKLLPYMDKLKELILYVNYWTLRSQKTPVWIGSFLSLDDLDALSTCLCGNLYFYIYWKNRGHAAAHRDSDRRSYESATDDDIWDEFLDEIGAQHKQPIQHHVSVIDEFVDDLIIVIKALPSKSRVDENVAMSSYERLTKRRDLSEGLGLDDYSYETFTRINPNMR